MWFDLMQTTRQMNDERLSALIPFWLLENLQFQGFWFGVVECSATGSVTFRCLWHSRMKDRFVWNRPSAKFARFCILTLSKIFRSQASITSCGEPKAIMLPNPIMEDCFSSIENHSLESIKTWQNLVVREKWVVQIRCSWHGGAVSQPQPLFVANLTSFSNSSSSRKVCVVIHSTFPRKK